MLNSSVKFWMNSLQKEIIWKIYHTQNFKNQEKQRQGYRYNDYSNKMNIGDQ